MIRTRWRDFAACRGLPLEMFFSDGHASAREAKAVCGRCPVSEQCLAEVLLIEDASRHGIYGGLTAPERARLVGPVKPSPSSGRRRAPCGSLSAYQRHKKLGEPVDEACRDACQAEMRRRRSGAKS